MDLARKYRPKNFKEIVGQRPVVASLPGALADGKKAFLLFGESGTGKTTTARIIAATLNCNSEDRPCGECSSCVSIRKGSHPAVLEIDAADARGIDNIRNIKQEINFSPLIGKYKVLCFDEAQGLTKDSQNALLKVMEDIPEGVCFILCSTEPNKIIKTLRNRCQSFEFKPVSYSGIMKLLKRVNSAENLELSSDLLEKTTKAVSGLPRNALIRLQQIAQVSPEERTEEVINTLLSADYDTPSEVITLCRAVFGAKPDNSRILWANIIEVYKKVKDYDKELIRISLAGYARVILERASGSARRAERAARVLAVLVEPLPLIKPENKLVLMLYNVYVLMKAREDMFNDRNQR